MASMVLFGFSPTFAVALFARFLWGALNGNIGVASTHARRRAARNLFTAACRQSPETVLSEVCDDSNQARGFSILGVSNGLGRIVAPVLGGFLSEPASRRARDVQAGGVRSPNWCSRSSSPRVGERAPEKYASLFDTPFFRLFPFVLPTWCGVLGTTSRARRTLRASLTVFALIASSVRDRAHARIFPSTRDAATAR